MTNESYLSIMKEMLTSSVTPPATTPVDRYPEALPDGIRIRLEVLEMKGRPSCSNLINIHGMN